MSWFPYARKRAFALPMTLILLTFCTFILLAASSQLGRNTEKMKSFKTSSKMQNVATNAVEIVSHLIIQSDVEEALNGDESWDGIDEFKAFLSTKGGVEKFYWASFLSDIDSSTGGFDFTDELQSFIDDPGLGGGEYTLSAHVYKVGERYTVVTSAQIGDYRTYALGLVSKLRGGILLPAVRMAGMDRVLTLMNVSGGKGNPKVTGDLIYGGAIILGGVILDMTASSTPGEIITGGVTSKSVASDLMTQAEIIASYPGWYTYFSDSPDPSYNQWKNDYLNSLPAGGTDYLLSSNHTLSSVNESELIIISPPTGAVSPLFRAFFDDSGLKIYYGDSGNFLHIPVSLVRSTTANVKIMGDTVFGNDPHGISKVCGHYNISVYGDITINTNIVYDYLYDFVNNGDGNSPVGNKTKEVSQDIISNMLTKLRTSSLTLASVGGDMIMQYIHGNSTHGNKSLTGTFFVWKDSGSGGDVQFPDIQNLITGNGHTPQLFILGSITAYTFDEQGQATGLDSFVAVADAYVEDLVSSGLGSLGLVGIQTW